MHVNILRTLEEDGVHLRPNDLHNLARSHVGLKAVLSEEIIFVCEPDNNRSITRECTAPVPTVKQVA